MLPRGGTDRNEMADAQKFLLEQKLKDSLPEWSKGVDSSSTSASSVGSNPTGVIILSSGFRKDSMRQATRDLTVACAGKEGRQCANANTNRNIFWH